MDAFPLTLIASVPTCISPHRYVLSPHPDSHPFMIVTPSHLTRTDTCPLTWTHGCPPPHHHTFCLHILHGCPSSHLHGHIPTRMDTFPLAQTHAHLHGHMPTRMDTCPLTRTHAHSARTHDHSHSSHSSHPHPPACPHTDMSHPPAWMPTPSCLSHQLPACMLPHGFPLINHSPLCSLHPCPPTCPCTDMSHLPTRRPAPSSLSHLPSTHLA